MKTTPWFPGDVKPVRVGVYQRCVSTHICVLGEVPMFSYWNGFIWGAMSSDMDIALRAGLKCIGSLSQDLEWRGLTEPTEKK